jgi:hypothetical protein
VARSAHPDKYGGSGPGIAEVGVVLEEIQRQDGNAAACHA